LWLRVSKWSRDQMMDAGAITYFSMIKDFAHIAGVYDHDDWMTVDEIGWFTAGFYGGNFLPTYRRLTDLYQLPPNKPVRKITPTRCVRQAVAHDPLHDDRRTRRAGRDVRSGQRLQ